MSGPQHRKDRGKERETNNDTNPQIMVTVLLSLPDISIVDLANVRSCLSTSNTSSVKIDLKFFSTPFSEERNSRTSMLLNRVFSTKSAAN